MNHSAFITQDSVLKTHPSSFHRRRAFFQAEVLIGLLIVGTLLTALSISVARQDQALRQFADTRAALRLAENTLTALQAQTTPDTKDYTALVLPDASPIPSQSWVQITAHVHNRTAHLIGLIPTSAIPKEATHANP